MSNFFNRLFSTLAQVSTLAQDGEKTKVAAEKLGYRIMELIRAEVEPENYPELLQSFTKMLLEDGNSAFIFPDMDYETIWYTRKPELISICNALGIGDARLTHWTEEDNNSGEYLEVTQEELATVYSLLFTCMVQEQEVIDNDSLKTQTDVKLLDCLKILEVEYGASFEEIKKSYRILVQVWHPDRFANNSSLEMKANEKLKLINEAYSYICEHYNFTRIN